MLIHCGNRRLWVWAHPSFPFQFGGWALEEAPAAHLGHLESGAGGRRAAAGAASELPARSANMGDAITNYSLPQQLTFPAGSRSPRTNSAGRAIRAEGGRCASSCGRCWRSLSPRRRKERSSTMSCNKCFSLFFFFSSFRFFFFKKGSVKNLR